MRIQSINQSINQSITHLFNFRQQGP